MARKQHVNAQSLKAGTTVHVGTTAQRPYCLQCQSQQKKEMPVCLNSPGENSEHPQILFSILIYVHSVKRKIQS